MIVGEEVEIERVSNLSNLGDDFDGTSTNDSSKRAAAKAKEQQSSYLENIGIGGGDGDGSSTEKSRGGGSKEMELHIGRNGCAGYELCSNCVYGGVVVMAAA